MKWRARGPLLASGSGVGLQVLGAMLGVPVHIFAEIFFRRDLFQAITLNYGGRAAKKRTANRLERERAAKKRK